MSYHRTLPSGTIIPFGGSNPPNGWLLCDGSSKTQSAYPKLYAAIGKNWGLETQRTRLACPTCEVFFAEDLMLYRQRAHFQIEIPTRRQGLILKLVL
jgi:hypothetical protein